MANRLDISSETFEIQIEKNLSTYFKSSERQQENSMVFIIRNHHHRKHFLESEKKTQLMNE